ncbi:MAG: 30S ribosomal protein S12 methylthiotransferase RimO, partial [Oscillospiraceae bacterium]|nr:30S ribosomal protein S12 methylthiotransferase RimO [Oscillospiraceae bacterium]
NSILKRMNRKGTGEEIRSLIKELRQKIPGLVLRTSLITGLPGEGEAEFEELCEFLKETRIERAGVFPFSPEEGTPAAQMEHCDAETAARRAELVMQLQADIMDDFCAGFIGKKLKVLYEYTDEESGYKVGRSYADSPDIDGLVLFDGECTEGDMVEVLIRDTEDGLLIGEQI